jgi:ABC-2 type transport system permease protein
VGIAFHPFGWLGALIVMMVIGIAMSAVGFLLAWRMDSVQGYHAIMNVLMIPMWLLSGAMFPAAGAAGWMRWIMAANPLTYGTAALRQMLYLKEPAMTAGLPSMAVTVSLLLVFATSTTGLAVWVAGRPRR